MKKNLINHGRRRSEARATSARGTHPAHEPADSPDRAVPVVKFHLPDPDFSGEEMEEAPTVPLSSVTIFGPGFRATDPLRPALPTVIQSAIDQRLSLGGRVQLSSMIAAKDMTVLILGDDLPGGVGGPTAFARIGASGKWVEMLRDQVDEAA